MRYFDKLTNFFASTYVNSPKHNSNFLSYLRIFFERNNKYKSTFAKLGNVFRNSKWSDLKVQNIKTPLISNWFSWALTLFVLSLFVFALFGNSTASQFFINIPFLTDGIDIFFYVWANFVNFVSLTWMQLWLTFVAFKLSILQLLGFNQNYMYKAFNVSSVQGLSKPSNASPIQNSFKFTSTTFYDTESLTLVYHLSKVNKSLVFLNSHYNIVSNIYNSYNPLLNKMYSLMPDVVTIQTPSNVRFQIKEVNNHTLLYTLTNSLQTSWDGLNVNSIKSVTDLSSPKFYTINNKVLQNLNNQQFGIILNNLNIYNNLTQAKQDRWLLKNSLLSNSTTIDLNAFTQTKKLIGMNLVESANTSRNIWNSSKMTQLTQTEEIQKLSLFQNFLGFNKSSASSNSLTSLNETSSGFQGFNWFETSSLWTTKKYFFTNQLKSNFTTITAAPNKLENVKIYNSTNLFNFTSNLHNTSLSTQLSTLNALLKSETFDIHTSEIGSTLNTFVGLGDTDLLKSFDLNVVNTLTLPITDKDMIVTNYVSILPYKKLNTIRFKK